MDQRLVRNSLQESRRLIQIVQSLKTLSAKLPGHRDRWGIRRRTLPRRLYRFRSTGTHQRRDHRAASRSIRNSPAFTVPSKPNFL
jgi:hypothetical protein